jgi:hypothetical protein
MKPSKARWRDILIGGLLALVIASVLFFFSWPTRSILDGSDLLGGLADSLDEAKTAFRAAGRLRRKEQTRNAQYEPICS